MAERCARLTEQGQQLRARVQEIEQQRQDRAAELRLLEGVEAFCASVRDAMVAPSFEVKQKVLQLVVQRIVVEDHRITIEHVVPSGPIRLQPEHHPLGALHRDTVEVPTHTTRYQWQTGHSLHDRLQSLC